MEMESCVQIQPGTLTGYRLFFMPVLPFNSRENSNSQWLSFQE